MVFFADEGGSRQISVNWRAALPAYFQCLAETVSDEQFALDVDQAIADVVDYNRAHYLTAASRLASPRSRLPFEHG